MEIGMDRRKRENQDPSTAGVVRPIILVLLLVAVMISDHAVIQSCSDAAIELPAGRRLWCRNQMGSC